MSHRLAQGFAPVLLLMGLASSVALAQPATNKEQPPITGKAVPRLKHLDAVMLEILRDFNVPGASLAIAKDGRLVFARGYGWADVENKKPVRPASRFNLASCSKPITAAAVLKLVDEGKLRLDDKVFTLLDDLKPPAGAKVDPRIRDITVRQLLHHAGGLVRAHGPPAEIARRLKVEPPITTAQATAWNLSKPLLFAPGTDTKYSNLGFIVLRLVVERVSGQDYEMFTAERVLKPMGISAAHLDLMEGYRPREVHRYTAGKCLPGGHGELKGGGCWVLSTVDAMRFMTSLDSTRGERVLSKGAYQKMLAPLPSLGKKKAGDRHNGLGWDVVERTSAGVHHAKNGGVAGIATYMEHLPNGVNWAVFFNGNLKGENVEDEERPRKMSGKKPYPRLREAIEKIEKWPTINLFETE